MDFSEYVKGFLMHPSKTFDAAKEDHLATILRYYITIALIFSITSASIFTILSNLFGSNIPSGLPTFILLIFLSSVVGVPVVGAFFHIFVYTVGGRKGITQTIKAFMYSQTPNFLLGWIPFIPIFVGIAPTIWSSNIWSSILSIWSFILFIIGIRQLHEITTRKAILAALMPFIILVIIALTIITYKKLHL